MTALPESKYHSGDFSTNWQDCIEFEKLFTGKFPGALWVCAPSGRGAVSGGVFVVIKDKRASVGFTAGLKIIAGRLLQGNALAVGG